ncbi:hypothetical protein ACOSQ3_007894 [Xanthoceras sorbifolium]
MAEHLVFSAQHPPEKMAEGPGGGANPDFHCKRARSDCDDLSAMPQRERVDSFKTKLLGVSNPSNWKGFGDGKEKITIEDSDFVLVEGSNGQDVILSEELKSKLRKPWPKKQPTVFLFGFCILSNGSRFFLAHRIHHRISFTFVCI